MSGTSETAATERFRELDVLRGLAALAVVLFHYSGHVTRYFGDFPFVFRYGNRGVQLFFMISGFVIYFTLERSRSWYDFAVSRATRLYPVYWAAIALITLVAVAKTGRMWLGGTVVNLTMLQSFLNYPDLDVVFWTLAVELIFYVLMAIIYVTGVLGRIEWVVAGWLALAWASTGALTHYPGVNDALGRFLILPHIPYFAAGIMFYRIKALGLTLSRATVLALSLTTIGFREGPAELAIAGLFFSVFALAISGKLRFTVQPAMIWLGAISYPLYLVHRNSGYDLLFWLNGLGVPSVAGVLLTIAAALGMASLLTYLVERPSLRILRGFYAKVRSRRSNSEIARGRLSSMGEGSVQRNERESGGLTPPS